MATPAAPPSTPPPSYPPASSADGRPSLPRAPGWRPADDDDTPEAVAWRARTSLRRADRALAAIEDLSENAAKLNATIQEWSNTWERHWRTLSRIAWGVGIPVLIAVLLGLGADLWRWLATLHH